MRPPFTLLPLGQARQARARAAGWYLLPLHLVHLPLPAAGLKLPAAQGCAFPDLPSW